MKSKRNIWKMRYTNIVAQKTKERKAGRVSLPLEFYRGQLVAAGANLNRLEYQIDWLYDDGRNGDFMQSVMVMLLAGHESEQYWRRPIGQRLAEQNAAERLAATLVEVLA